MGSIVHMREYSVQCLAGGHTRFCFSWFITEFGRLFSFILRYPEIQRGFKALDRWLFVSALGLEYRGRLLYCSNQITVRRYTVQDRE